MESAPLKTARIEARVSPATKDTVARAAAIQGLSLSEFLVDALLEKAERVIGQNAAIDLGDEASRALFDALRRPPKPNAKLKAAFERHQKLVEDRR